MPDILEVVATQEQHTLTGSPITIGREPGCTIVLNDASVSRKHCTLTRSGGVWSLRDDGSRNGTEVAGLRLEANKPFPLKSGEPFRVGQVECIVRAVAAQKKKEFATQEFAIEDLLPQAPSREAVLSELMFKAQAALFPGQAIDSLLEQLLELTLQYVPATRAAVQLWSPDEERLEPGIVLDKEGHITTHNFLMSTGVADRVMRDRKTLLIRDVMSDEEFKSRKSLVRMGITSAAAAPLFDGNDILGILYADLRNAASELDESHTAYISVLAAMGGTALVAAQMISALMKNEAQLRDENERLRGKPA